MTANSATLVGVARPLPEVATFVTPIFRDGNNRLLVQDVHNNRITQFLELSSACETRYLQTRATQMARRGDFAVFAFEMDAGKLALGNAYRLIQDLRGEMSPAKRDRMSARSLATRKAIRRFVESIQPSESLHLTCCRTICLLGVEDGAIDETLWDRYLLLAYIERCFTVATKAKNDSASLEKWERTHYGIGCAMTLLSQSTTPQIDVDSVNELLHAYQAMRSIDPDGTMIPPSHNDDVLRALAVRRRFVDSLKVRQVLGTPVRPKSYDLL